MSEKIPEEVCVLLEFLYIKNIPFRPFVEANNKQINLSSFPCYTIGNHDNDRVIIPIRFISFYRYHGRNMYQLEFFGTTKWVKDTRCLRSQFFRFSDKTSFLRSTFLYDEKEKCVYRIHRLLPFLYLQMETPHQSTPIYLSLSESIQQFWPEAENGNQMCCILASKKQKNLYKLWKEFLDSIYITKSKKLYNSEIECEELFRKFLLHHGIV